MPKRIRFARKKDVEGYFKAQRVYEEIACVPELREKHARRLLQRVRRQRGGCWKCLRTPSQERGWYGIQFTDGAHILMNSPRMSYLLFRGRIPLTTPCVMHICDNPRCVNPEHLRLGTHADNMEDMKRKGRDRRVGEQNGYSILTEDDVKYIRRAKHISQRKLAKRFGVHQTLISLVRTGKVWKHV